MTKSKKKSKPKLSVSMFRITGSHTKMKVITNNKRSYYFSAKIDPEKASKAALKGAQDILGVSAGNVKAGKPTLKYDFYCIYDAELKLVFLRVRNQELGVNDQVKGAYVGKEVLIPKKGKNIPGQAIHLEVVELFEIKRSDAMVLDGKTGGPAASMEKTLKGPGKRKASDTWLESNKPSPGKFNSLDKVVRAVSKPAGTCPSDAKRIVEHTLTFNRLEGYHVPVYYITLSAGDKSQKVRINGIDGELSLVV